MRITESGKFQDCRFFRLYSRQNNAPGVSCIHELRVHTEGYMKDIKDNTLCLSSELRFYTISDLQKLLGWSEKTVKKMFNDPAFPSIDFGRNKVVEAHAAIEYFSKKHEKAYELHWQ